MVTVTESLLPGVQDRLVFTQGIHVGSLEDPSDLDFAVDHVVNGGIVAAQVGGVFGMWGDGWSNEALDLMIAAKEEPNRARPFSNMRLTKDVLPLVDLDAVHPSMRQLLTDADDLGSVLGTLIHLRLPLKEKTVDQIPLRLRSQIEGRWVIHNLDPTGHPISGFIRELKTMGVRDVALTTLNKHQIEPEISELARAMEFCRDLAGSSQEIPILLIDPTYSERDVKGSMVIVDTLTATVQRKGFIPTDLVKFLLKVPLVEEEKTLETKYPQAEIFATLLQHARRYGFAPAFTAVLARQVIRGYDIQGVIQELAQAA